MKTIHTIKLFLTMAFLLGIVSTSTAQETLSVGSQAPDFELETIGDEKVKLSDNFGENGKTTVLAFSRANW